MISKGNFLLLEPNEFRDWLQKQKITRTITKLQVHHTWKPNYSTRRNQDHFACLEGIRRTHLANGWSGTGQNITIFEDGKIAISLDRDLNKIPAGIAGANTGALCVEIIGNFDRGGDNMTSAQKQAVVHVYACLADKLNIPVNTAHIVYHAWYTAQGVRLGDYTAGRSSKTCPGTNFWGDGNTVAAANKGFIPAIKQELERLRKGDGNVDKAKVYVNDQKIEDGFILEGRVYVPLRAAGEALDAKKIEWDNKTKTARLYK